MTDSGVSWWIFRSDAGLHVIGDRLSDGHARELAIALLKRTGWRGRLAAALVQGAALWP